MKPTSIRRRVIAALLVISFAFAFMEATGGASGVRSPSPLERAAGVVAKKHCARARTKRGKKKRARRACRFRKAGLTPLVPPVRGSAASLGQTGGTGATGATGTTGWPGCHTTQCFVQPPCNALPSAMQDESGTTGPWGTTGPSNGPKIAYWVAGDVMFLGQMGCAFDRARQWENMPPGPSVLPGDTWVEEMGRLPLSPALVRLVARVVDPGAPSAELRAQYSTDRLTWSDIGDQNGLSVSIGTPGLKVSDWIEATPPLLGTDPIHRFGRVIGIGGDGVSDPSFSGVSVQVHAPLAYNP